MKNAILFTIAGIFSLTQLSACSSEDWAFGTGVVIGVIIGDHDNHHHRHHRRHRRPYRPRYNVMSNEILASEDNSAQLMKDRFTKDFGMNDAAAGKLADALLAAETGDSSAIEALGLREKDLKLITALYMPAKSSVAKVAENLNEDSDKISRVFEYVIAEIKAEGADINSDMWVSCLNAETWKTPENPRCSDVRWNGCSPDTGATLCSPR